MRGLLSSLRVGYIAIFFCIRFFVLAIGYFQLCFTVAFQIIQKAFGFKIFCSLRSGSCRFETQDGMQAGNLFSALRRNCAVTPRFSGRVFPKVHGDVEALACITKAFPADLESFNAASNGREWVKLDAVILQVGPAGFSSVPYQANARKGTVAKTEALYTNTESGTMFYSFLKGKTNKDRGDRVSEVEDCDVTAVLREGVGVSWFVRKEKFEDSVSKIVEFEDGNPGTGMLQAGKIVVLQLGSSNTEQALKGQLIKLKKLFCVRLDTSYQDYIPDSFPNSVALYDTLMDESKNKTSIANILQSGNNKYFMCNVRRKAYMVPDSNGDGDDFVLCDALQDNNEVQISNRHVCMALGCNNTERALKLANIAIACGGIRVLLSKGINFNTGEDVVKSLQFIVDVDAMMKFELVAGHLQNEARSAAHFGEDCVVLADTEKKSVLWFNKNDIYYHDTGNRLVAFRIDVEKKQLSNPWNEEFGMDMRLCDGVSGLHYAVQVALLPEDLPQCQDAMTSAFGNNVLLKFQVKEDCFGSIGGGSKKRKRYAMSTSTDKADLEL